MRYKPFLSVVLAAALLACIAQPELLNSDRIQQRFGSYGVEVLHQDDRVRRSNLYSLQGGERICRTYAVVQVDRPLAEDLESAHASIVAGASIGAALRAAGWQISKETLAIGSLRLPDSQHSMANLMHLDAAVELGLHAYRLRVIRKQRTLSYATIVEVHHPDHLTEADLLQLHLDDTRIEFDGAALAHFVELALN